MIVDLHPTLTPPPLPLDIQANPENDLETLGPIINCD